MKSLQAIKQPADFAPSASTADSQQSKVTLKTNINQALSIDFF
jgi:hypothetical protein